MNKKLISALFAFSLLLLPISADESHGSEEFKLGEVVVHHLSDQAIFPLNVGGGEKVYEGDSRFVDDGHHAVFLDHHTGKKFHYVGGYDLHITKRVTMMWIVSFFLLVIMIPLGRSIAKDPYKVQSRATGALEAVLEFLKKDVIDSNMHGHGHGYYGYLFSLFFFILFCNLFGLIPPVGEIIALLTGGGHDSMIGNVWSGITVTGDVSVTMPLAVITLILIYATGFLYQGPLFPVYSVPNGVPAPLYLLMFPLEFIVSPLAKAFALTVRLLANMTAGHVVILALLGFIFQYQTYLIVPVSILGATAIFMLEIFVAFLQAFIFTLLTSLFVGSSMHRH
ncbi:MAG: F0F1 ATP synthase subunit A [Leptospiraceae bacterium]|nr:F0F1 ATP synthase subunit A [Leptospiraceae bacterium]